MALGPEQANYYEPREEREEGAEEELHKRKILHMKQKEMQTCLGGVDNFTVQCRLCWRSFPSNMW